MEGDGLIPVDTALMEGKASGCLGLGGLGFKDLGFKDLGLRLEGSDGKLNRK